MSEGQKDKNQYASLDGAFCEVINEYVNSGTLERMCRVVFHETNTRQDVKKSSLVFVN